MTADRQPSLRDQIAGALVQPWPVQIGVSLDGHRAQIIAAADAVLYVIEAHILAITVDATRRADELAGRLQEAEAERDALKHRLDVRADAIAAERRGRLAAEAANRRVRALIDSYPPGSRFARSGAQALFRAALDAEQPKETP